jgi:hypothetical protein
MNVLGTPVYHSLVPCMHSPSRIVPLLMIPTRTLPALICLTLGRGFVILFQKGGGAKCLEEICEEAHTFLLSSLLALTHSSRQLTAITAAFLASLLFFILSV